MVGQCDQREGVSRRKKKRLKVVGQHILGDDHQPGHVTIGIICESFGCLPSEVMDEDWSMIKGIMEYRLLASARDQHNNDASNMSPGQIEAWREMVEAVEDDG